MQEKIYVNGELFDSHQAAVSVMDRGLLYGDGLFETIAVYRGQPFLAEKHLERMRQGAQKLEIPLHRGKRGLEEALTKVLDANRIYRGSLRLTLTRGKVTGGLWPGDPMECQATVIATAREGIPYTREQYREGFKGIQVSFPRNEHSPSLTLKSLNFLENILGRAEAQRRQVDEGLFVNQKGYLTEGTISNLFVIREGVLYTPPARAGLLEGITRRIILEASTELMQDVREENLKPFFLKEADEAFLTNSLVEIIPLVNFNGIPVGRGGPGKYTQKLQEAYQKYVLEQLS